jgi:uncharacterized membrane protein (UPF0127 family)
VRSSSAPGLLAALLLLPAGLCSAESDALEVLWVPLGGETFQLELALDAQSRQRGLSGREKIPRGGGMLFVLPSPRPFAMVMRDCPNAIDVAFLDATGRVVAIHEMPPEPPRAEGEPHFVYESRLPMFPSGEPVQFAIETAGGRLAAVGLAKGDVVKLDFESLAERAR